MRDKLKRQDANLYSTYANLGEFLIRANLWPMLAGDAVARERFQEGRDYLRRSVGVNPQAHFGREEWQLVAVEMFLGAGAEPEELRKSDLIGNRLDLPIEIPKEQWRTSPFADDEAVYGRPYHREFTDTLPYSTRRSDYAEALNNSERRDEVRHYVYKVGGETPPAKSEARKHGRRAPFDEPALWLIGEWRQGSGPSPHLALCLGEIMLRVGQRYLAWTCYERAARLADRFSPRAELRGFLRSHCQSRQAAIEKSLPPSEVASLRPKFEAELAFGEAYQRDFQAVEEDKIRAGGDVNDPHFFDAFHSSRPPIASKVGAEEWYAGTGGTNVMAAKLRAFRDWGLLTGGAAVLLLALVLRWCCRPNPLRLTEITPRPSPGGELPPASSDQFR
jgi:hypothetical protein